MPTYHHICQGPCKNPCIVETSTISEYMEYEETYGRDEGGGVRVPCPQCCGWAVRDYSRGVAAGIVKGGSMHASPKYANDAKKNWYANEVKNTKEVLRFKNPAQNPYGRYSLTDPEAVGFKKASSDTAKARSEAAKKLTGDKKAKQDRIDKNR